MAVTTIPTAGIADGAVDTTQLADDAVTIAKATGFGKIGQVVEGTTTTDVTSTSSTFVDSNLTANITPSSSSSKILVQVNQFIFLDSNDGSVENAGRLKILRDSTSIFTTPSSRDIRISAEHAPSNELRLGIRFPVTLLDSPSTTSQITYKTQIAHTSGVKTVAQSGSSKSFIILMEVLA